MIKVHIKENLIQISGHANFAEYKTDIVCSAVSTAIIMTLNLMELFNLSDKIKFELTEGYFQLLIKESDEILNKISQNLEYTVGNLALQYPKNVKIYK